MPLVSWTKITQRHHTRCNKEIQQQNSKQPCVIQQHSITVYSILLSRRNNEYSSVIYQLPVLTESNKKLAI